MLSVTSVTLSSCLKNRAVTSNMWLTWVELISGSAGGYKNLILRPWGLVKVCRFLALGI